VLASLALFSAPRAHAQFAVIDVAAVGQLIEQLAKLEEQLATMREQLDQAHRAYEAITGDRGMQHLLEGAARNYLPPAWEELEAAMQGAATRYGELASAIQAEIEENKVLTDAQIDALSAGSQQELLAGRRSAATLAALTHASLETTSQRFESLQALIDAIASASDEKAILDLQARIQAEQAMLENESNKVEILFQTQDAEERVRRQRERERAIDDIGRISQLPDLAL
jgi:type IV secretion system protein VirB5